MFYIKSIEDRGYINSTSFLFSVAALKTNLEMTDFQKESPSFAVHKQIGSGPVICFISKDVFMQNF